MIQFHATPQEAVGFVESTSRDMGLVAALIILKPFEANLIEDFDRIEKALSSDEECDVRVALGKGELDLTAKSLNEFMDRNPDCVTIDIGSYKGGALNESSLSFRSDNSEAFRVANEVATKLRKLTKAGVIALNPDTGAEAKIRSHRYTEGAKHKYDKGVKILPVAGKSLLKLVD